MLLNIWTTRHLTSDYSTYRGNKLITAINILLTASNHGQNRALTQIGTNMQRGQFCYNHFLKPQIADLQIDEQFKLWIKIGFCCFFFQTSLALYSLSSQLMIIATPNQIYSPQMFSNLLLRYFPVQLVMPSYQCLSPHFSLWLKPMYNGAYNIVMLYTQSSYESSCSYEILMTSKKDTLFRMSILVR